MFKNGTFNGTAAFTATGSGSWYWATGGSVDYVNNYCGDLFFYSVPANAYGFQYARTGSAYCGFGLYLAPIFQPNGYREYLGGQLLDTLKQGHTYCISFYVVKADSGKYYTSDIGMYLSPDSSVDYSTNQINNAFTADSYYYIDDVSVIDCTVGINEIENLKDKINLMPNPAKDESVYRIILNKNETGQVILYSKLGVKILNKQLAEGNNTIVIPLSELGAGVYFVQSFIRGKNIDNRKLVVVK